jgi:hypothetical protein
MLVGKHYQNGYVCDNLEAGIAEFRARGLAEDPTIIPVDQLVDTPDGPKRHKLRICMFWLNGIQYELIEAEIDETGVYRNAPGNGGPVRFHHICLAIDDWPAFRAELAKQDLPVAFFRDRPTGTRYLYLDGREAFGHYLEYTAPAAA